MGCHSSTAVCVHVATRRYKLYIYIARADKEAARPTNKGPTKNETASESVSWGNMGIVIVSIIWVFELRPRSIGKSSD